MKLIESSVSIIRDSDPFVKIETAGRTCYKSEAKITTDSAKNFTKKLINSGHTAMVEHAQFVFLILDDIYFEELRKCKYLNCTHEYIDGKNFNIVSGNVRAINDLDFEVGEPLLTKLIYSGYEELVYGSNEMLNEMLDDHIWRDYVQEQIVLMNNIFDLNEDITRSELMNHCYYTLKFICDRAVTHEIVRHRTFSFAQESQRYVDYNKSADGITFIKPEWLDNTSEESVATFLESLNTSEMAYRELRAQGVPPQAARGVLPNATKTEIVVTGSLKDWCHFFDLRASNKLGRPHPDIMKLAKEAMNLIEDDLIDNHNCSLFENTK